MYTNDLHFQAYDFKNDRLIYPYEIDEIGYNKNKLRITKITYKPCDNVVYKATGEKITTNQFIILPFTGIEDRAGRKIYLGDKVKIKSVMPFADDEIIIGIVRFLEGSVMVETEDKLVNLWREADEITKIRGFTI